ncbi:MAG: aminotransferase class I/II-fold pyridoxal phosphate-dependent enzyme [Candidatus Thermoplasmatota archaeon]|nr:aminotransferase class I/II-fold pyridoxal phosphate-dependent enzyme [Candidatus Thermoplasmatota archaeon]MCL5889451.1 aminotransferase class I/II-fold pyridoxal phosphate-dependent enzyme [Candidatus Thermoplasmatota archaeon]
MSNRGFNTRAVGSGEIKDKKYGNVVTPIFQNATFIYPNYNDKIAKDPKTGKPYIYSRSGNPTLTALEEKYASLEGTENAISFSTGMAAITSLMMSMVGKKKEVLSILDLYGQTLSFFKNKFPKYGIGVDIVSIDKLNSIDFDLKKYDVIYAESITNPSMKVLDLKTIGELCNKNGITLVVDATFCSPYNQNPVSLGADYVVHSGTKYLNGHSDTMSGFVGSNRDLSDVFDIRMNLGGTMDAFQAYLIQRGMKTLGLRMKQHNESAIQIAEFLMENPHVISVNYPGLSGDKYHSIAEKNMRGFGGMLSFRVKGGLSGARKFMKGLESISAAPSLGGVESLATLPIDTSHSSVSKEDRKIMEVTDDMVRLSVGIEDAEDIKEELGKALSQLS